MSISGLGFPDRRTCSGRFRRLVLIGCIFMSVQLTRQSLPQAVGLEQRRLWRAFENPATAIRPGAPASILKSLEVKTTLPDKPKDLVEFARVLESLPFARIALPHFHTWPTDRPSTKSISSQRCAI